MKKVAVIAGCVAAAAAVATGAFCIWQYNIGYHECNIEAGTEVNASSFLKNQDESAAFLADSDVLDVRVPGDYLLHIKTDTFRYKCLVHVVDTIAPAAKANQVRLDLGETAGALDFVTCIQDATPVAVSFKTEPDFSVDGYSEVSVILTDMGGNTTEILSGVTVNSVEDTVVIEAGERQADVSDFLLEGADGEFITDMNAVDYSVPGDYPVEISVSDNIYECTLKIEDTIPPQFDIHDYRGFLNCEPDINEFVDNVSDATAVSFKFETEPDLTTEDEQTVNVTATDLGGNTTTKSMKLTLAEDTEAPEILGVHDRAVMVGRAMSYKDGITVTDNNPVGVTLDVDTGGLDVNAEGAYTVTYTATDASGNRTVKSATVFVRNRDYTEEAVWEFCDNVLSKIINDDMTQYEKAWAIYRYVRYHIVWYEGHSPKTDWIQGAVDAFTDGTGDCYMYACMSKALLTRAGIPNIDICRDEEGIVLRGSSHYWNLVNVDDTGWLHFDACPNIEFTKCFLWTDSQAAEYSENHTAYYSYDPGLYPEVNP